MPTLLAEIYRRNRPLAVTGWFFVLVAIVLAMAMVVDHRELLGVNVWIKPIKFLISVTIYLWTLAWFLAYLERPRWVLPTIAWGASAIMVVELTCVIFQAGRGRMSHFNQATPLDAAIFSTMGLAIVSNTVLEMLLLVMFCLPRSHTGRRELPAAYLWGIRIGLVAALFSAAIGMQMIANHQHTVGVSDGGPGLPLVNWSTTGGDLRAPHALTLHGLQLLPLAGYLLSRWPRASSRRLQLTGFSAMAIVYATIVFWTYWQAIHGQPFLG